MKKLLLLIQLLTIISCTDADNPYNAKINDRGCVECDAYAVGDEFVIDGIKYIVADKEMIIEGILHKKDVTRFCTSRITDMSNLFTEMARFHILRIRLIKI